MISENPTRWSAGRRVRGVGRFAGPSVRFAEAARDAVLELELVRVRLHRRRVQAGEEAVAHRLDAVPPA